MNLYNAWIYTMQKILTSLDTLKVEDYLELRNYTITFSPNDCQELLSDERVISDYIEMRKVFFSQEANIFGHNYSKTLLGPKMGKDNAVEDIVQILRKTSTTRKAVLSFLPYGDEKVPCINLIHFLIRNNKLEVTYFSRGQDIYRKFPCDAMCIIDYGRQIAKAMHLEISQVTAIITSAHVYEKDIFNAKQIINKVYSIKRILTGNKKKYEGFKDMLSKNGISLLVSDFEIPEIQSIDPIEVIKNKARYAFEKVGLPVWVDDVSLSLDEFPLFPGSYTKHWFKQIGIEGLKSLLANRSNKAVIYCRLCSFDGKKYNIIEGKNKGYLDLSKTVLDEKMPLNSIFISEQNHDHRSIAIQGLINYTYKD